MAGSLKFSGFVDASVTNISAIFSFVAQTTYNSTPGYEELAIEYDIKITSMPGPFIELGFVSCTDSIGSDTWPLRDQEGRPDFSVTGTTQLVLRAGTWYRRVIRIPDLPSMFVHSFSDWKIGLWGTYDASRFPGAVAFEITNIRLTNYRETVFWFWREGMAAPTFVSATGVRANFAGGLPTIVVNTIAAPELPAYCSKADDSPLDDISHRRRTGGRLNSYLYWDDTKDSFKLTDITLDAQQRWDLRTFYDIFRRDSIVYRHQSNLPAMWVRFNGPPQFKDYITPSGQLKFKTELTLLRR